jgi:multidrug efflux pump subunit AcrA (membrane-fusion protein)
MVGGLTLVVATLAGCGERGGGKSDSAPPATPTVSVVRPQRKSVRRVVEQPGGVTAYEETQLFARVPGYVSKVHFDIGQKVESGQVLADLSVPEMVAEVSQKHALVRQATADVEQANKALAAAEANIATAEASVVEAQASQERWESESRRIAGLAKRGVLDTQTRDETRYQFKAAEARVLSTQAAVRKARADRDKAKADVRSAEARIDVATAEAQRLEALLVYAKIRAPFAGVVTRRKVNTGDLVQPQGGKGDWLFTVARLDPVRIVIDVPEADAGLVQDGSAVSLSIPALRIPALTAKVTRTSWALAPGSRTLRAEIDLPNGEGGLRPGLYVYAKVTGALPESWTLPAAAVVKLGDTMACFRIENGKAVRTPVLAGRSDGTLTEVLKLQKGAGKAWADWTGKEEVAASAAGLSDGVAVERK